MWSPPFKHFAETRMTYTVATRRTYLALTTATLLGLDARAQTTAAGASPFGPNVTGTDLLAMNLKSDGITLDFPRLADSGSSVPITAEIVAPAGQKIAMIDVYLPDNPNTRAARIRLVDPQARYTFTTRLRLAASQDAWVVATMTDGSRRGASAPTIITSSACLDAS
jgi:predicted secreted protein